MSHGKFLGDTLSDDESAIDVSELPSEYRVKGFLRSACNDGHETLARVLLDKGADVNYITTNTQLPTALHVAVSNTRDRILPILLPQASSATIQAALQYAIQYRSRLANIIRILQQDGSTIETSDNFDKDVDKSAVEAPKKSELPEQKERETQTTNPAHKENETQTNGEHNGTQTRQQSDHSSSSSSPSPTPPSLPSSSPHQPQQELKEAKEAKDVGETREVKETKEHGKHDIDIQRLQQQLQEQQQQLQEQQHKLQAQETHNETGQRRAAQSQQAVEQAQRDLEEMRTKLQTQEDHIGIQNKQVQQLNEQLAAQEVQAQAQGAQLATQVGLTQRLTEQLATQETHTQKLRDEVREQLDQIGQLKIRIQELEEENKDLGEQFQSERKKSEEAAQEFQNQILALQTDIESKTLNIENVSKERDSERRAKEIARRILSSNGPNRSSTDDLMLGHSHAIRMGSLMSPTPPALDDEDPHSGFSSPTPNLSSSKGSLGRARGGLVNGIALPRSVSDAGEITRKMKDAVPRVGAKLTSKSRAKDDMDIASEAERARVKRLVERWEEMKYLELKSSKQLQ